MFEYLEIVLN